MLYWEDVSEGRVFETGTLTISEKDILEFAEEFDPQPYHLDKEAAKDSIFGELCASGWHMCAVMMRLLADTLNRDEVVSVGSSGVSSLRWFKPVFANDTLRATITVTECLPSDKHSEFGYVKCAIDVKNQDDRKVIAVEMTLMIARRQQENTHV